jgi:long-chain acyl-CoA synthetase
MHSEIVEAFDKLRRDDPSRRLIYLPTSSAVVTAADLSLRASAVQATLTAAVDPGQLVLSALGNVPLAFALLLACRASGCVLLPLDAGTIATEIRTLADQFGAAAIVAPATMDIPGYTTAVAIDTSMTLRLPPRRAQRQAYSDVALLKLTSGSSGQPRATLTPESALVSDGRTLAMAMDIQPDDVQIAAIPCSHSYGLGNLVMPLLLQGTAVSVRDTFVPQRMPDDARAVGARHLPGAPYMFDHFATLLACEEWPASLTRLVSAGAPLRAEAARRFHAKFGVKLHPFYGTSETGGISFDVSDTPVEEGAVGPALPDVEINLVESEGLEQGYGRVHVRSAAVSRGYAGDDGGEAFVDGGFLTSDLGTLDPRGQLTLFGRVSSFVNVAGRKVQPEEVERVLRQCPAVSDARVVGLEDALRGERLVACIVVSGRAPTTLELRQFCSSRLAAHKIPRAFVVLDAIPLTTRGKTDRARLLGLARAEMARAGML